MPRWLISIRKVLTRRRALLAVFAIAGGLLALRLVRVAVFDPLDREWERIRTARYYAKRYRKMLTAKPAILRRWRRLQSLSARGGIDEAKTAFQAYINDLVRLAGLPPVRISTPADTLKKGVYLQISYNISGHGSLADILDFLFLFSRNPRLQQARSISLRPKARGDSAAQKIFNYEMKLSRLLLPGSRKPKDPNITPAPSPALTDAARKKYHVISTKNIFFAVVPTDPLAPRLAATALPAEAVAEGEDRIAVTALVRLGEQWEVWTHNQETGENGRFAPGEILGPGKIVTVRPYELTLKTSNGLYRVSLGQTLAQRQPVSVQKEEN